jgi:hypothetical protein
MRVVLFFIDGLGLAPAGENNPLATTDTPALNSLLGGLDLTSEAAGFSGSQAALLALDATLGMPGSPQSATGQTTLFTGRNAAELLGRHLNGFPNARLRRLLADEGLLRKINEAGHSATFLNCYRPSFFAELDSGRDRFSATTLLNYYAGLPFRTFRDMQNGEAVCADITNEWFRFKGFDLPVVSPEQAGKRLANVAHRYDFLLFEHFLTDLVGHRRCREKAGALTVVLDRFIGSVLDGLELSETLFVLTSDHGNFEDLQTAGHTRNPVPLLLIGARPREIQAPADLTGVAPYILQALDAGTL